MASGQTLVTLMPRMMETPIGRIQAATEVYPSVTGHCMAAFDKINPATGVVAEDNWGYWSGYLPRFYSGGPLVVRLAWSTSSARSPNVVVWACFLERHHPGMDMDGDYITGTYGTAAACTCGYHPDVMTYSDLFPAKPPGMAASERFRFALARDSNHAYDTAPGQAELHSIEIREQ
jgi:hypothetical protein